MKRLALWFLMTLSLSALAQQFPSRPVKIVVPTTPGGATDALSRSIGARLSEIWGQPVVVENKPGATQIIGGEYVAKSPPDGYTLIVSDAATFIMNPILHKNLSYDGLRAFTPITLLVRFPWVVAIHPSVPANNFQEFVAYARTKPGVISYGSFGTGSSGHISVDYMKKLLGIDIVHIPYKGAGPAGMPREVTYAIYGEVRKILAEPAFRQKFEQQWFEVVANTPDEFAAYLKTDYERTAERLTHELDRFAERVEDLEAWAHRPWWGRVFHRSGKTEPGTQPRRQAVARLRALCLDRPAADYRPA